jgi:hypothetical protein
MSEYTSSHFYDPQSYLGEASKDGIHGQVRIC